MSANGQNGLWQIVDELDKVVYIHSFFFWFSSLAPRLGSPKFEGSEIR